MDVNEIESYFDRLWPLNRSLTGEGNRQTIKILSELVPFNVTEVPAGTSCYDWKVPAEWNVKEAWIKDTKGNIIIDFSNNNLHLMGYSIACHELLSYGEFYQFNLSSCIRQQNSLTAQFVSFSLSNLANIFYPPQFLQ